MPVAFIVSFVAVASLLSGVAGQTCSSVGAVVTRNLVWNSATGKFTGTMTSNQCPRLGSDTSAMGSASSITQTFPQQTYTTPAAVPLTGRVGLSIDGVNIYSAFEAGFGLGVGPAVCSGSVTGVCQAGMDIEACKRNLTATCGASNVFSGPFGDSCRGHASPYHYHEDMPCSYTNTSSAHSGIVGLGLDGVGIYGRWEAGYNNPPTDLDACGGHYGYVPVNTTMGITESVIAYHYHLGGGASAAYPSGVMPFTLGCFGPASSVSSCQSLYPSNKGCGGTSLSVPNGDGTSSAYDDWCPCKTTTTATVTTTTTTTTSTSTIASSSSSTTKPTSSSTTISTTTKTSTSTTKTSTSTSTKTTTKTSTTKTSTTKTSTTKTTSTSTRTRKPRPAQR